MQFRKIATVMSALVVLSGGLAWAQNGEPVDQGSKNVPELEPAFPEQTRAPAVASDITLAVQTVADGLNHPWGIAILPSGDLLVTERSGQLRTVGLDGTVSAPIAGVPIVVDQGQGGLLDVAISPDFEQDRLVYLTYSKPINGGMSGTAAVRGTLSADGKLLASKEDIFVQEPPSPTTAHYGSRVLFDGQGHVFVTTGEHFTEPERALAQDLATTYGKTVRLNMDGSVPPDNPFVTQEGAIPTIWSYGHRNIQGAAYDAASGRLWTIEHGPQGGDELNIAEAGKNYGWPIISYGENYNGSPVGGGIATKAGMEQPVYYWDPVIAPGGMLIYDGAMFDDWQGDFLIGSLNPGALVRLEVRDGRVTGEERLLTDEGRVRDVEQAPDGALLVLIDDTNGKVLRLSPKR